LYGGERQEFTAERPFQAITHPVGTAEGCDLLTLPLWRGGLPPLGCKAAPKSPSHYKTLWRGSLLPLGCAAAPKSPNHYKTPWRGGLPPLGCAAAPKSPNHYKTLWRGGLPPSGCAAAPRYPGQPKTLWRGSLLPLGCAAAPKPALRIRQVNRSAWFHDCYAAEREQAPSPQKPFAAIPVTEPATAAQSHPAHHTHRATEWRRARQNR